MITRHNHLDTICCRPSNHEDLQLRLKAEDDKDKKKSTILFPNLGTPPPPLEVPNGHDVSRPTVSPNETNPLNIIGFWYRRVGLGLGARGDQDASTRPQLLHHLPHCGPLGGVILGAKQRRLEHSQHVLLLLATGVVKERRVEHGFVEEGGGGPSSAAVAMVHHGTHPCHDVHGVAEARVHRLLPRQQLQQ